MKIGKFKNKEKLINTFKKLLNKIKVFKLNYIEIDYIS
jgi:hypothetical protein